MHSQFHAENKNSENWNKKYEVLLILHGPDSVYIYLMPTECQHIENSFATLENVKCTDFIVSSAFTVFRTCNYCEIN